MTRTYWPTDVNFRNMAKTVYQEALQGTKVVVNLRTPAAFHWYETNCQHPNITLRFIPFTLKPARSTATEMNLF